MKSIVFLFCFCTLFSSCYSYQPIVGKPSQVTSGIKHHFDLNNGKEFTKKIDSIGTDGYYITKGGSVKKILFSDVRRLEEGTFSVGRTLGLSGIVAIGATALTAIIIFLTNWPRGNTDRTN